MKRADVPKFGPLQDLKVINFGTAIAAPVMGTLFAEMGADLIMIESPLAKDLLRVGWPMGWPLERRNNRSISVDIFHGEGREILAKLLKDADILIESTRAGTWAKNGWTDEALWEVNPKLVIVHVSGFGQYGDPSYVAKSAYDPIGQCMSGNAMVNGYVGDGPMMTGPFTSDYFTSYTGAWASLAAYIRAQKTGKGESIDLAMFEATMRPSCDCATRGFTNGESAASMRSAMPAPYNMYYQTKDGRWIYFLPSPKLVTPVFDALGLKPEDGFARDIYMMSPALPIYPKFYEAVKAYAAEHTFDECNEMAIQTKALLSPVMDYPEMLEDPHFKARNSIIEYYEETLGKNDKTVAPVPKFKNEPQQIWRGGFTYGMDNDDILEELGYTPEQIAKLYEDKLLNKD